MLFSSPFFLLAFLPFFLLLYFISKSIAYKNIVILIFSSIFFIWGEPVFFIYVVLGTFIDFLIVRYAFCNNGVSERLKRYLLIFGISINISALAFFKYANFFVDQTLPILNYLDFTKPSWYGIALPLGISFIAFHKISFLVDLYKSRVAPPKNFWDTLIYIILFPQLIAGPIVRYEDIGPQIVGRVHSYENFESGFFRFVIGLSKKCLIADPAGGIAATIFSTQPILLTSETAWIGAVAYCIQIYFDFSGYSDMAIGLARMIGFKFPENFNQPYTAKSITDFWARWHMTLSKWMSLYLYIPLGGNRVTQAKMYLNLWIVFLLSGFWHGSSWTFIAWGAYFGFFLSVEKILRKYNIRLITNDYIKQSITFFIIINSWVLFRSDSLEYAVNFYKKMYGISDLWQLNPETFWMIVNPSGITAIIIGLLISLTKCPSNVFDKIIDNQKNIFKLLLVLVLFYLSLSSIFVSGSGAFLYFRF
jgi:alginate O-acetyltransferase complex protein AlgI